MIGIRGVAALVLALLVAGLPADAARAGDPVPPKAPAPAPAAVDPAALDAALRRAIKFLDEAEPKMAEGGSPKKAYTGATAAWAGILLGARKGAPNFDGRRMETLRDASGRYIEDVARTLDRLTKGKGRSKPGRKEPAPPPPAPAGAGGAAGSSPLQGAMGEATQLVWPVSIGTHMFSEAAARGWKKGEALAVLRKAVAVLESTQQSNGGWGHDDEERPGIGLPPIKIPKPWGGGSLDYPGTLLAASNLGLSALGVAHRTLGTKAAPSLEKGRAYFAAAQDPEGTFPYDPSQKRTAGSGTVADAAAAIEISRTAGSVFALGCAGAPAGDPVLDGALRAIEGKTALFAEGHGSATLTLQWAALGARARGAESWAAFRAEFLPRILAAQDPDGAFRCVCKSKTSPVTCEDEGLGGAGGSGPDSWKEENRAYVTAIHILVLALDGTEPKAPPRLETRRAAPTPR